MNTNITGVWDLTTHPFKIGGLLVLLSELEILRQVHSAKKVDLSITGAEPSQIQMIESVAGCFEGSIEVHMSGIHTHGHIWPDDAYERTPDFQYESTLRLADLYKRYKIRPTLRCKKELRGWVKTFLSSQTHDRIPVAIHLKHNPGSTHCSNANVDEWSTFFSYCETRFPVTFFLVGNDIVDRAIQRHSNVIVTEDKGCTFVQDMAIIEESAIFMGMASGPANKAMLGDKPYVIYKDPEHSKEEMLHELGTADRYVFASQHQNFYRVRQNARRFIEDFEKRLSFVR